MYTCITQLYLLHLGNHRAILTDAGYTDIREYRYFKKETRGLDYEGMMKDLKVKPKSIKKPSTFT
jgi:aspartate/tyrosine/aromatic aminotransferase